jgi:uncharacterized protein
MVPSQRMWLSPLHRRELLALARQSIDCALASGRRAPCPAASRPEELLARRSSFVTLRIGEELRGCCGSIDAVRPLADDVWCNAFASAFSDPRFPSLTIVEWPRVDIHISVLGELEPVEVDDEATLLRLLQPGIDGIVLELDGSRATFLPDVWEQIEDPQRFLRHLKTKGGWAPDFWSRHMRVWRYTTEGFGEEHA